MNSPEPIHVVGLTGGIGSGKTAVSDRFAALGVSIIDTDLIARALVEPGQAALQEIVERFGPQCLTPSGTLNRRALRETIFSDDVARHDLEAILHPRIDAEVRHRLSLAQGPYAIVVIPLLAETGGQRSYLDRILVVDVDEATQIERVMARDAVDQAHAEAVIRAQASREQRLAIADDTVLNNADPATLAKNVEQLHTKYLEHATWIDTRQSTLPQ